MTIVTPSKWLADLVKESFLGKYRVEVINNGIDLDIFKPTQSNFRKKYNLEDKFIILGVASDWTNRKGLNYFIELSKVLEDKYKIVIIGVDNKKKNKLPSNIISINRTNDAKELAEIYTSADVFINPTLEDNFPTTNIEALACGTPVITFNTGGSVESVDENTGKVVEKYDVNGLVKAIKTLKVDRLECLNKAKLFFNKNKKFEEYVSLYGGVIR